VLTAAVAALVLASCQPAPSNQSPREFEGQWHELLAQRNYPAAQRLIDQRQNRLPDDPEVVIARANLYFRQSTSRVAGFAASGRRTAVAGDSVGLDTLLARRALDTLRDGIRRHPDRLDMRLGLAYLCQQLGMRIAEVEIVGESVAYAHEHPDALRWSYGEPLPLPAEDFVPQVLHEYVRYYVDRGAPGDDRVMLALAQIIMQAYPRSPYVPNDVAFFYGAHGDWKTSLEFLERAEHADSTDALVLYNLGWAHEQLKQRDAALHYYRRAFATGTAGRKSDVAESASQRLAVLGAKP
jgi:tetratricopeptide (TPR) repeat protein